jgi:TetR/AcrR family transcriptional regulator, tetracycline repressor protein
MLISRERAVVAALKAIDEHGLENFSLAAVADRLRVQVPSLYYHFHDKSELLTEVARKLFLDAEPDIPRFGSDWKEWCIEVSLAVRRSLLRHPNAVSLLLLNSPRDMVLKAYERTLNFLERSNISKPKRLMIIAGMDAIQWGSVLFEAAAASRGVRSLALFDLDSFDGHQKSKREHAAEDERMFRAVCRSFLDGLPVNGVRAKTPKRTKSAKTRRGELARTAR